MDKCGPFHDAAAPLCTKTSGTFGVKGYQWIISLEWLKMWPDDVKQSQDLKRDKLRRNGEKTKYIA